MPTVEIVNEAQKIPGALFALGSDREKRDFYFIMPPESPGMKEYYRRLRESLYEGHTPQVRVKITEDRIAELMPPTRQEFEQLRQQISLYSVVDSWVKTHPTLYNQQETERNALKQGRAKIRLDKSKLARDIARIILQTPEWVMIQGNDAHLRDVNSVILNEYSDRRVNETLREMKYHDDILDSVGTSLTPLEKWCLETEIVNPRCGTETVETFLQNKALRRAVRRILEPYKREKTVITSDGYTKIQALH